MNYNIPLEIATASSSRAAKWKNKRTDWKAIAESLSQTERTDETVAAYAGFSKDRQDEIKDVGGFVGGRLMPGVNKIKGKDVEFKPPYGWRRKGFVEYRQLVALDVDFGSLDTWLDFRELGSAGLFYTTHKHKPTDPRLRIVFPLDRPVSPDEYECIARVVASWIDIEVFDDTTYQPTRLMYYPSTSKNGEYLYDLFDAPIMCADEVLNSLEDWTDFNSWPCSSREVTVLHRGTKDEVENPLTKEGIVGSFCRSFTIEEAIDEFLPEVYAPCEDLGDDRYTYLQGSTSGGLVIYNHLHAYSHHNSDPAGQILCNAFDLVRLHKFGDLDASAKPDTDPGKMPSFKAMAEFAGNLKEVKKDIVRERRTHSASDYGDIEARAIKVATDDDWVEQLETEGKNARIKNTIDNVYIIMCNDENLKGRVGFNEFEQRETALLPLPWDKKGLKYPRPLVDSDDAQLRLYLERAYGISQCGKITDGMTVAVRDNSYHPVRDYLDACDWDGEPRLERLLIHTLGAPDTELTRAVTVNFFTAAVARIYRPGIKFDYMLTIVGEQGIGKSTLFDKMGGDWFSDSVTTFTGTAALESIQGSWIIEMGEMAGLRKADVEAVKQFVAKKEDRYRVAYGKRLDYFPRRCVFGATTNEDEFLRDVTGNRRYWVINTKGGVITCPVWKYLTPGIRSQVWAEAKHYFEQGRQLHLDDVLEEAAKVVQDAHLEKDERHGLINEYLNAMLPSNWNTLEPYARRQWLKENKDRGTVKRIRVSIIEIWSECLGKEPEDIEKRDSYEIGRILKTFRNWKAEKAERIAHYGLQRQFRLVTDVTGQNTENE